MHTDRKIGFALGILLVGVVAALFFRNEPLLPTEASAVRRERELNERLRDRDVAVYVDESRTSPADEPVADKSPWTLTDILGVMGRRNRGGAAPVSELSDEVPDGRPPRALDSNRRADASADSKQRQGQALANHRPTDIASGNTRSDLSTLLAPDSIEPQTADDAPRPLPPPPQVDPTNPAGPSAAAGNPVSTTGPVSDGSSVSTAFQPPAEFDEYIVQYGDTLSGIAQKFLGSQSRFQELFEANRDRMDSPDRLSVGKPLRIPRK
jgi:LysM repeat protein